MQNKNKKYLNEINSKINNNTVPEFGNFAPIAARIMLEDDSCLVFQVKPNKEDSRKKELTRSFINGQTAKMTTSTRIFKNKEKLLNYIESIKEEDLEAMISKALSNTQ